MDRKKILDSLMRHLVRLMADEELDSESKLPHIGHILCNAMFYSYHNKHKQSMPNGFETKNNPLAVWPHHASDMGGDPSSNKPQYYEEGDFWYIVSPELGYPFNSMKIMSEDNKKELARRINTIALKYLTLLKNK